MWIKTRFYEVINYLGFNVCILDFELVVLRFYACSLDFNSNISNLFWFDFGI